MYLECRPPPYPPHSSGFAPSHASLVQREVSKIGSLQPIFDGGIATLEMNSVSNVQTAPCRGRHFLVPTRKYPKNRLRGGALSVVYPPLAKIGAYYPDPKAPSPDNPSRRCAEVKRSEVWFLSLGCVNVGACCRAQPWKSAVFLPGFCPEKTHPRIGFSDSGVICVIPHGCDFRYDPRSSSGNPCTVSNTGTPDPDGSHPSGRRWYSGDCNWCPL